MLVNRVGDVGLVLGISLAFLTFKSVDYAVIFALTPCAIDQYVNFFCFELRVLTVIAFFLF